MVVTRVSPIFIYGIFLDKAQRVRRLSAPIEVPTAAIEILREFSAIELIGKVYALTPGRNWQPLSPSAAHSYDWFKTYRNIIVHKRTTRNKLFFESQDGDFWEVVYLRQESDTSGPYIAVALQLENS